VWEELDAEDSPELRRRWRFAVMNERRRFERDHPEGMPDD
jgi:hypothetical protein